MSEIWRQDQDQNDQKLSEILFQCLTLNYILDFQRFWQMFPSYEKSYVDPKKPYFWDGMNLVFRVTVAFLILIRDSKTCFLGIKILDDNTRP